MRNHVASCLLLVGVLVTYGREAAAATPESATLDRSIAERIAAALSAQGDQAKNLMTSELGATFAGRSESELDGISAETIAAIVALLDDESASVRFQAMHLLRDLGPRAHSALPILEREMADPDRGPEIAINHSLGESIVGTIEKIRSVKPGITHKTGTSRFYLKCPDAVVTRQNLQAAVMYAQARSEQDTVKGWRASSNDEAATELIGLDVRQEIGCSWSTDRHPSGFSEGGSGKDCPYRQDSVHEVKAGTTVTWRLAPSAASSFECRYQDTTIVLSIALPAGLQRCVSRQWDPTALTWCEK